MYRYLKYVEKIKTSFDRLEEGGLMYGYSKTKKATGISALIRPLGCVTVLLVIEKAPSLGRGVTTDHSPPILPIRTILSTTSTGNSSLLPVTSKWVQLTIRNGSDNSHAHYY